VDFHQVVGNIYLNLYSLIITANSLLPKLTGDEDQALKGELHFLRAYSYFKLARLFGTPPLVTDPDVKFTIQKPGFKEVYELIEKDLLMALELLPDDYTNARIPGETPHRGTAKALLAEVYLSWAGFPVNDQSKYAQAALLSGEVIERAGYYNFALLPDIADLWNGKYRHNQENIFGLFFNPEKKKKKDPFNLVLSEDENNINARNLASEGGYTTPYIPEFRFYNNFPNNYRKQCSYPTISTNLTYDYETKKYVPINHDPLIYPCTFTNTVVSLKWIDLELYKKERSLPNYSGSQATLYLLRYAQTLLTYAEASARSGKLDESAYEAVNMVRRRANKLDIHTPSKFDLPKDLTTDQFLDAVVWERAWELSFEPEGRWFDIVRLELKDKISSYGQDILWEVPLENLTDDWYFYKIPIEDRLINPNFE
ncbi:MAG TPA: hypothetical protein DCL77_18125, partial [Prolixibacteraceae bacterium]|nr:hypothetical protein [Prolixibacteraceae bacterium]